MLIANRNGMVVGSGGWRNPYVTDGLIAMWDGEWNVGPGLHDAAATTWKDIVGGIELEVNSNANVSWNSEGLVSASAIAGRYAIQNTNVPDALCAQILLIAKSGTSYSFNNGPLVMNLNSLSNGRYSLAIADDGVYRDGAGDGTARIYATTSADLTSALANGLLVTMNYGSVKPKYADEFYIGNNVVSYTGTAWGGGNSNLGVGGQSSWVACQGVTLARTCLYSRNITAAEIAANYAVDAERFNLTGGGRKCVVILIICAVCSSRSRSRSPSRFSRPRQPSSEWRAAA